MLTDNKFELAVAIVEGFSISLVTLALVIVEGTKSNTIAFKTFIVILPLLSLLAF